jgi:hypothetical protein
MTDADFFALIAVALTILFTVVLRETGAIK